MEQTSGKHIAKVKLTLNKRTVDALEPEDKPWIAWDDRLTGFGVRVHPSGRKSYVVNYRAGNGGRKAPNKRVVVGRAGRVTPDQARRLAQELLGKVSAGQDPSAERAEERALPRLGEACRDYIESGRGRAASTERGYKRYTALYLGDWLSRPVDAITHRDIDGLFRLLTERHGEMPANQCLSFLRSAYRRPCVDHEGLRNPVEQWLAAGGRYHRKRRKRISSPAEVLPCWRRGMEAAVKNPVHFDVLLFGLYTGMRRGEVTALRWADVDLERGLFRVEETKTGQPLELPLTRQLEEILARRMAGREDEAEEPGRWVFPSPGSGSGHVEELHGHYEAIGEAGGAKFWFHALRNCFITVAERDLMLPRSLTKRLVNHARPQDVTEGYAADWTVEQLREPARHIADRIDELMTPGRGQYARRGKGGRDNTGSVEPVRNFVFVSHTMNP